MEPKIDKKMAKRQLWLKYAKGSVNRKIGFKITDTIDDLKSLIDSLDS